MRCTEMTAESGRKAEVGPDLSRAEAEAVMEELLEGRLAQADIVGLLTCCAPRAKRSMSWSASRAQCGGMCAVIS